MDVCVVVRVVVVAEAELIDDGVVAVLNGVDEVLLAKEGERSEYAGLVECDETFLKLRKRQRAGFVAQCLDDDETVGGRPNAMLVHQRLELKCGFCSHVSMVEYAKLVNSAQTDT